jgi:hypothetical protein
MRRLLLVGALLLVGCQGIDGPRARRDDPKRVDDPRLTIGQQEQRGLDRLALPQEKPTVGPPTYLKSPYDRSNLEVGH